MRYITDNGTVAPTLDILDEDIHTNVFYYLDSKNNYDLLIMRLYIANIDNPSSLLHMGKLRNVVYFVTPMRKSVLSAADGIVTYIEGSFSIEGPDISYFIYSNFIVIKYLNGAYFQFDNLDFQSSRVNVNQDGKSRHEIGRTGLAGFTLMPYLHFQIFISTGFKNMD